MRRMSGGRAVAEALRVEGIAHVFGIVGTHSVHLFDGLFDEPAIQLVTPRHEQGAAMMAAGYARASGRIAACYTVPGPGLTNALTGLGMAYAESVPLLLIAAQNPLDTLERELEVFHELRDSLAVAGAVCGFTRRVSRVADIPISIREAMRALCCRRPRPAYLEIPLDVLAGEGDVELLPPEQFERPSGSPAAIARAAELLGAAERPLIYAGGGATSAAAGPALRRLAERLQAPVVTSSYAKGVIPEDHPLSLGDGWGQVDHLYAYVLERADLALVVGARFDVVSDGTMGARLPERLIQVDLDPTVIGQRRQPAVGIVGDAASTLEALAAALPVAQSPPGCWFEVADFLARKRAWLIERTAPVVQIWDDLLAQLPPDAIVVDDLTLVGYWAPLLRTTYRPRTLLHPGTFGTLGYALPSAIGAKLACPRQPVVAIVGDGGFLFTLQELATARAEQLDLVVLLFNDNAFGALEVYQDRVFGGNRIGSALVNPDFVQLGQAFGAQAERVEPAGVGAALGRALAAGGLWLIEVPFRPTGQSALPPWMP